MRFRTMLATVLAAAFAVTTPTPAFPQKKASSAVGDVAFEVIGRASLPGLPPTLIQSQHGYLSYVGVTAGAESIFAPGAQNETTALLTFYNDTVAERLIDNGTMRVINRVGTSAIYLDTTPDGDFNNPETFRDGVPVQRSELRLQFILDTVTGAFTATLVNTIIASDYFHLGNHNFLLGKVGQTYRTTYIGHVTPPGTSPAAYIAGFAVGDLKGARVQLENE